MIKDWLERITRAKGIVNQTGNVTLHELDIRQFTRDIFFDLIKVRSHCL